MAMERKNLQRGLTTIGPTSWINSTIKSLQESNDLVRLSGKCIDRFKSVDPLPGLRDSLADLSNEKARGQFRELRIVTYLLRDTLIDVNTEIKSLARCKEALEKCRHAVDKDVHVNNVSMNVRQQRPGQEKASDSTDGLLQAERQHLMTLKRSVETEQKLVQQHLQVLDSARRRISAVLKERSRALDLVTHSLPPGIHRTAKAMDFSSEDSCLGTSGSTLMVDPLGAYTPEADSALDEAKTAVHQAKNLRKEAAQVILRIDEVQKTATRAVNDLLTRKIAETTCLSEQLTYAMSANRLATNKAQKMFDMTENTLLQLSGPVSMTDVSTRERLDRPLIRTFQRHPGTNLPEAHELVKGTDVLLSTLQCTGRHVGRLKLAHQRLAQDEQSKRDAINIDGSIMIMRRRKVI